MGGVGSGKTYTSIAWAHQFLSFSTEPLYVITTASNRNRGEWHKSIENCGIDNYVVDSWNNIEKYVGIKNAVFIFDEQRVVGYGKWSKHFIQIAWDNTWILTSATPGDIWMDYIPLFVANKFFRNKTDFIKQHVEWEPYAKYPIVKRYHDTDKLERLRDSIIIRMDVDRHTKRNYMYINCDWDSREYFRKVRSRFNEEKDRPVETPAEMALILRKHVALAEDRQNKALEFMRSVDKLIIFYNTNYELETLRTLSELVDKPCYEYNGHKHDMLPTEDKWLYLVQYTAGAEGWNCITTDSILFYSASSSYKKMEQAYGRIDRMNTPFVDLKYYILTSQAPNDKALMRALNDKKQFNDIMWVRRAYYS